MTTSLDTTTDLEAFRAEVRLTSPRAIHSSGGLRYWKLSHGPG